LVAWSSLGSASPSPVVCSRPSVSKHWALVAAIVLAIGFVVFCLVDLARAEKVRYLPKWLWAVLCMGVGLTIPFGGILYLVAGKDRHPVPPSASS